jgi:DNA repair protein RecO (recombination protein O)
MRENLIYVSPKSARAVSADAGAPWASRLLPLPGFLLAAPGAPADSADIVAGLRLTEYFLIHNIYAPRGLKAPDSREAFISGLADESERDAELIRGIPPS